MYNFDLFFYINFMFLNGFKSNTKRPDVDFEILHRFNAIIYDTLFLQEVVNKRNMKLCQVQH